MQRLLKDFIDAQVSLDAFEPAGTKDTAHPASDLRTQTHRPARAFSHQHTLDPAAVAAFQHQLISAVRSNLVISDPRAEHHPFSIKLLA